MSVRTKGKWNAQNAGSFKMRWAEQKRMEWLSKRRAPFNRADLMAKFGISIPQASKDIQKYILMFPNAFSYNKKLKRYEVNK